MGRRNKVNANGLWVIPGGGVDWGETIADAAVREIKEESNLDITKPEFMFHKEIINLPGDYHAVVFFFKAKAKNSEELKHDDDLSEIGFFTIDEIKEKIANKETVQSVEDVLRDAGLL